MNTAQLVGIALAATLACTTSAQDHIHMTVDTMPTGGQPMTLIQAGYLNNESEYSIDIDGRLLFNGEIAVIPIGDQISGGTFDGYFGGQQVVLTSDFFFSTGRLAGGDFNFELADVQQITGPAAKVLWVHTTGPGVFVTQADSSASTQIERSYNVGIGGHQHAQLIFIEHEGIYDVTFLAWDSNGVYSDSETVTVRIQAGDPVICVADVNGDGMLTPTDFTAWINAFNNGSAGCDQNGDGSCTPTDFTAWIANYNAGC